jgi:hypothetical protein
MYEELKWLNANYKFKFEIIKFVFKIVHGIAPNYFYNYLCFENINTRQTRNTIYNSNTKDTKFNSI